MAWPWRTCQPLWSADRPHRAVVEKFFDSMQRISHDVRLDQVKALIEQGENDQL